MDAKEARNERRRDQVREEILDATRRVLLDRGLAGLTLNAVARELELTKAALYYYFDSKEALLFELVHRGLANHAAIVGEAIDAARSGATALEALIRASADHYGSHKDDLRLAYLVPQVSRAGSIRMGPERLSRIRPFNDRLYGGVAEKIDRDQREGRVPSSVHGRRLAFLAHNAVIGMLTLEGLVEAADDGPLLHSREALVEDLVATFCGRLAMPAPS